MLYNPGPVAEQIRADGTSVRDLGMRRNTQLGALLRLRSVIADGRYDVVHTHLYRTQIYARPAARLAGRQWYSPPSTPSARHISSDAR